MKVARGRAEWEAEYTASRAGGSMKYSFPRASGRQPSLAALSDRVFHSPAHSSFLNVPASTSPYPCHLFPERTGTARAPAKLFIIPGSSLEDRLSSMAVLLSSDLISARRAAACIAAPADK